MKRVVKRLANPDEIRLEDAFEEFILEKRARNLSEATIRNYKQSYQYFMDFIMDDDILCCQVEQAHLFKWMNSMLADGTSPASINHYLRDIRAFFLWCMNPIKQYINPPFKVEMVKGQEEPIKFLSQEEQLLLLERPDRKSLFGEWRTWAIVNFILGTGCRSATVRNIKLEHLNFSKREITYAHTKNKKAQTVPMSKQLETVLKEFIRLFRSEATPDKYLFPNVGEELLSSNALRLSYERYVKARGVSNTSIHSLRHTFAREFILNNGNTFYLQKILGHSTITMTEKYVRLFSDDIKKHYEEYSPLDTIAKGRSRTKLVK